MAARKKKKAKAKAKKKSCLLCGGDVDGKGDVCGTCSGGVESASRRVAEKVRDRMLGTPSGGFVCPYCRTELTWSNIGTSEEEVTIYVREKIYYCPGCRAFLGVSSWHTEG